VIYGAELGRQIMLEHGQVLGRSERATVRFDVDSMSRRHAELQIDEQKVLIRDLGSTHGILLNGDRVTEASLRDGDRIQLGRVIMKFLTDVTEPPRPLSPSAIDGLTGLANKRTYHARLAKLATADRGLSLVWFDIDAMVQVNYKHGHVNGDRALIQISRRLEDVCAPYELARIRGDVFAVILPLGIDARALAQTAVTTIASSAVFLESEPYTLTISAGVATATAGSHTTVGDVEAVADRALYAAKCAGRNRVA